MHKRRTGVEIKEREEGGDMIRDMRGKRRKYDSKGERE